MNIEMEKSKALLSLIRLGLGHDGGIQKTEFDWLAIKALADQQELTAVVFDGIERLKSLNGQGVQGPDQRFLLQWIGEVMQNYETRYVAYEKTICTLAGFYNQHGYKMMVLKGYACSLDWSKPNHRPCGDIDIWLFGKQKEADALLESFRIQDSSFKIDRSHHHHTVFYWNDFMVENHYDFINVHSRKPNIELEKIFKELGKDDSHFVELNDDASTGSAAKVYLPSPNLHALFLMRHLVAHFTSVNITLRQVLDWAFFVEKHAKEIDREWLIEVLKRFHMIEFYNTINAICVGDLGFDAKIFPSIQFRPDMKDKVLKDILYPKYSASEPSCLIPRLLYKYRRWQGNAWKQKLCYSESRWESFWVGLLAHLLKPKSI